MKSVDGVERLFGVVIHEVSDSGVWNSRRHRKGRTSAHTRSRPLSWAISILFLLGSILFVVGGFGAFGDKPWVAWLNFVGALLFSGGAVVAVLEARDALIARQRATGLAGLWADPGGRAALIQLPAAAVLFQLAMTAGLANNLDWVRVDGLLWTPSTIGSVGFVASSWILWREARPARDIGAATAITNLAGSVGFLVGSAAGYFDEPPFGLSSNDITNPVFLIGSFLFAVGSALGCVEIATPA